jgi:V8-like Glu-specific endopeptidase
LTNQELRYQIEQFLVDGSLGDAIGLLLAVITGSQNLLFLRNDATLLLAQHAALQRDFRIGTLSTDEGGTQLQRLRRSTLELLGDIEKRSGSIAGPYPQMPIATPLPDEVGLEKIIGAVSHLKSIAWLSKGLDAARSVCRIVTPDGLGTGFMIRPGIVVTNHHVLPSERVAKEAHAEFNYQESLVGSLDRIYTYEIDGSSWIGDAGRDCAVVQLRSSVETPFDRWGTVTLETVSVPPIGGHVSIIQHPGGRPKQIAVTANQVVGVFGNKLHYTTDTLRGSSGSPVFNDDWSVVAVHHAGGNLEVNQAGDKRFINEGILVKYLRDLLQLS